MYVYHGGLNFFQHAVDEAFVIVIPGDFAPNDPICGYWQWTKDPISGWGRKNNPEQSVIKTSLQEPHGNLRIGFVLGDYTFDAVIGRSNLQVTMSNATRDKVSGINYLELSYSDETKIPSSRIYTAKFTWDDNTSEEMLTVVVPDEFLDEQPVCAYFQRTKEGDGEDSKERDSVVTRFAEGSSEENREVHASFTSNDGRTWDIRTEPANRLRITGMRVPGGDPTSVPLVRSGFSSETTRKALIVRYDVGTDGGIFRVRDLLYMLGFHETSVEMLYYDLEPQNGPRICGNGQQAPTAKRFKKKFAKLLKGVQSGDVRFLYIDAHTNERGEPSVEKGWKLAQDENGRHDEIVPSGWVPEQIHKNLTAGVNLTILIPSGSGGCINDNIRGILFAGCHESQTSVKVNDMDPWTLAIVEVVERCKWNRSVPTYAQLYTSARKFITDQIHSGELPTDHYFGPTPVKQFGYIPPNHWRLANHQDPQLIFCEGYMNVDTERFLCPLAREGWDVGLAHRFPRDER